MIRFETLAAAGASLALLVPATEIVAHPPVSVPSAPERDHPGIITPRDITDLCVREAFGINSDGSIFNPANSAGEEFPDFRSKPHLMRITHLFGPKVDDVCEAQVVASRQTVITPMFQSKKGRYIRASENPRFFTQRSNTELTGLSADDPANPKGKNLYVARYASGNILLKATTTVTNFDGTQYHAKSFKVVYPNGTAAVGPVTMY